MPLALLLTKTIQDLGEGIGNLQPWNRLVAVEMVLLARARGAFLVRWFGPRLPLHGEHLRIAIVNLDALRARYEAVRRATPPEPSGLNLTEPVAGLAGQVLGAALSPAGLLVIGSVLTRRIQSQLGQVAGALLTLVAAGIGPAVLGGLAVVALPFAVIGGILLGVTNPEEVRSFHGLMGDLAALLEAFRHFVEQLLGPREGVRNPLVRAVLEMADRLAVLLPFVMALAAVLVARIGPLLLPLAAQVPRLRALIDAVVGAVVFVVQDLAMRFTALYTDTSATSEWEEELGALGATTPGVMGLAFGLLQRAVGRAGALLPRNPSPLTIIVGALRSLLAIPAVLRNSLAEGMRPIMAELSRIAAAVGAAVREWVRDAAAAVRSAVLGHTAVQALLAGREIMVTLIAAFRRAAPSAPAPAPHTPSGSGGLGLRIPFLSPPPFPTFERPIIGAIAKKAGPEPLHGLSAASIHDLAKRMEEKLSGPLEFQGEKIWPFSYGPETLERIQRMERPRSVFTAERLALRDAQGRTPAEQLAAARGQETSLRAALMAVVERVLPAAVASYLPQLTGVFRALEERVYPAAPEPGEEEPAPELPVRRLPSEESLLPVVHRLRIVAAGVDRREANAWGDRLREALVAQSYSAAAGVPA